MRRSAAVIFSIFALTAAVGCAGEESESGLDEPLRVTDAVFKTGKLPGKPAAATEDATDATTRLTVTSVETSSSVLRPGQTKKTLNGRATDDGYAIALRFADLGSGYWVKPLQEPDTAYPGQLSWRASLELAGDLPIGNQRLLFVVIDERGQAGVQQSFDVCVVPRFDTSLNACDPSQPPPAAIISLTWDVPSDLDLIVKTPSGKLVDARHPSTRTEGETDSTNAGVLYTAHSSGCADNVQREDLIWRDAEPESGTYLIYANLFAACGTSTTHFAVSAYLRSSDDAAQSYELERVEPVTRGELLSGSANGGTGTGLYVTAIRF
jgi:hypothetical protein